MGRKKRYPEKARVQAETVPQTLSVFDLGAPQEIFGVGELLTCMECLHNGRWYETPLSFYGLGKQFTSAVHHQSPLFFKRNVIMSCFKPHPLLSYEQMMRYVMDYLVFGNAYLQKCVNRLGGVMSLRVSPAIYTRRGLDTEQYWYAEHHLQEFAYPRGRVFHLMNPDIHQEIYGLPEYLAGLVSAGLNRAATMFRMYYYENGQHGGQIVYFTDSQTPQTAVEKLKADFAGLKGAGAFKNVAIWAPGGRPDGIKVVPFSQISAKDEFINIKDATRDDLLAVHRVPPVLMGIIPEGNSNLGDVEKAAEVFAINELLPVMRGLSAVNQWLGEEVVRFSDYALIERLRQGSHKSSG